MKMKKNIWLISKYASPPQYAKAPSRLFYLAREFKKLGNEALLITSDANHFTNCPETDKIYNDEEQDEVAIRWIKTKKYIRTASKDRILSWFDFERKLFSMKLSNMAKPDVVIVSSLSIFTIIYGYYLKKKFGSFLVFEIRDIWPLTMTEEAGFSKWHPLVLLIGFIEKFGYKKSDLVAGTMPRLDLHVEQLLGYQRPFHCSPLGFDPENHSEDFLKERNPFLDIIPSDKIIVGYAGSMGVTNALEPFIETVKMMKDDNNIHFVLVGSGDLRASYEETLKDCSNVTFLQRIQQSEVKYFLDACDILYLSTKDSKVWEYGQSMNKVVEYMLAAKPIIASYTGYPSMINEADCGKFINSTSAEDIKDAILYYGNMNAEERMEIGDKGRKWIFENRTYPVLGKKYMDAILFHSVKQKK
ncbi:glycosyltransferase involved in cell wall biosynthesis [Chryseobacterium sp. CBTAP 102]|uniref:glycosyltransferase family 4 protein n=1 Tax=Chryseobacterium sp. CBTAP 102 TaxID=2135644 RepID=UPI000D76DA9D|nr:glycosyltransferase family 4 protein [Chryseobacterium sp. CBTAP 102]PXW15374.1 glycosyltransferase involved in cell wall biosynthesis [Chryseobacterium sp. CBTAP 102]